MKRLSLKINGHLKSMMVIAGILGASAYLSNHLPAKDGFGIMAAAPLAFVGVAEKMKKAKKWDDLDEETKEYIQMGDAELKALYEGKLDAEAFDAKMEEYLKANPVELPEEIQKTITELEASVKKHAEELGKKNNPVSNMPLSFLSTVTKALEEHKEDLDKAAVKRDGGFKLTIKAANSTVTTGYASSAPNAYMPVPMYMPGFVQSPEVPVTIMELVDLGNSDSPTVAWVNEKPIEGDAGWTAENELKSQVAWKYENETSTAKKVTAFIKVTTQALRNIPWLASRINTRLRELLLRKMQDGIINGDGTNEAPLGMVAQAPGYITDSFDNSVKAPTTADALMAMAGQIDELEYDTSNLVAVMNGVDIRKMKWEKDENNNYIIPPFVTASGTYIDNMRVVKNNKITKGYALVGDLKKFTVLMVEDLLIDIGLDGNDFTYNRRTIICEAELITMLSDNDAGAFCYAQLSAVKAEIDQDI